MPHVIADERAMFWAVGAPIVATGLTEVGAATLTGLALIADADENAFLDAVAGEAVGAGVTPLPEMGKWCEAGTIYAHGDGLVICRQSHARTEHDPADIPALFIVYREDAASVLEWIAGEQVHVGTRRLYAGAEYECLQAHVTQSDWTPPSVPALWRAVVEPSAEWQAGTAYKVGDRVLYAGLLYECRQAHTAQVGWEPPNVLALWLPV